MYILIIILVEDVQSTFTSKWKIFSFFTHFIRFSGFMLYVDSKQTKPAFKKELNVFCFVLFVPTWHKISSGTLRQPLWVNVTASYTEANTMETSFCSGWYSCSTHHQNPGKVNHQRDWCTFSLLFISELPVSNLMVVPRFSEQTNKSLTVDVWLVNPLWFLGQSISAFFDN